MVDRSKRRDVSNRGGIIGGSSLSSLDQDLPWGCTRQLAYRFLGYEPTHEREYNEAMRLGHFFEPQLREWFCEVHKVDCKEGDFIVHPEYPFIGGHPDGIFGDDGIIEIKTASKRSFEILKRKQIYDTYQDQLTLYMSITERYKAYFVVGCSEDISIRFIREFYFDKYRCDRLIEKIVTFAIAVRDSLPPRKGLRRRGKIRACTTCEFRGECDPPCLVHEKDNPNFRFNMDSEYD